MDTFTNFGWGIIITNLCILTPIIIICCVIIQKFREEAMMKHRDLPIILAINIICIFMLLIDRPLAIAQHILNLIEPGWISLLPLITAYISMCSMCTLFAIKGYSLFYKQRINETRSNPQPHPNWYVSHQKTFGNVYHLLRLAVLFIIITLSIEVLIFCLTFSNVLSTKRALLLFESFIIFLTMVITSVILYKIRDHKDIYKIRNEVFLQFIVLLLVNIVYIAINMCCFFIPHLVQPHLVWSILICATNYPFFLITVFNTMYPIYQSKSLALDQKQRATKLKLPSHSTTPSDIITTTPMDMRLYLTKRHRFESFMRYLAMEFACENLMFLKEYTEIKWFYQVQNEFQIKIPRRILLVENRYTERLIQGTQYNETVPLKCIDSNDRRSEIVIQLPSRRIANETFYSVYLVEPQSENDIFFTKVMIPKELPQGNIMRSGKKNALDLLFLLVDKYIDVEGEHPLNIAYSLRKYIMNMFSGGNTVMDLNELFCILDECAAEILTLMYSSFVRYCECEDFKQEKLEKDSVWSRNEMMNMTSEGLICSDSDIQINILH
eukprot:265260_1